MSWIFIQCSQYQGQCIRSYAAFGLAIFVCFVTMVACIMNCRQMNVWSFQQLPLSINFFTSLSLSVIYSQTQVLNVRLILLLVQLYSYFLLTFGFIFHVLRKAGKYSSIKEIEANERKGWIIFWLVTVAAVLCLAFLIFFAAFNKITCVLDQQIGSILILAVEVPLTIITFVLISKAKVALASVFYTNQQTPGDLNNIQVSQHTHHLIIGQDSNKKLNYKQVNVVRLALVTSLILHAAQLSGVYLNKNSNEVFCNTQSGVLQIKSSLGLCVLSIQSVSQLFPHIIIPFILWYLNAKPKLRAQTLYLTKEQHHVTSDNTVKNQNQASRFCNLSQELRNEEKFRDRINRGKLLSNQQQ